MYGRLLYSKTERFEKLGVLLVGLLEVSLSDDMTAFSVVLYLTTELADIRPASVSR